MTLLYQCNNEVCHQGTACTVLNRSKITLDFTVMVIVDGIFLLIFFLIVTHFYVKIRTWIGQALYLT